MHLPSALAAHVRQLYFGGNWTWSNYMDVLTGVKWEEALQPVSDLNTIAVLLFHTNYYVDAQIRVMEGGPLDASDAASFVHGPLAGAEDWQAMIDKTFTQAEHYATLLEKLPEERLNDLFVEEKNGSWYRNIQGLIEHNHYHLGQIALLKKLLQKPENVSEETIGIP